MAFFRWVLDYFPSVRKKSSLHQYWRVLKMLFKELTNGWIEENVIKDVNNVWIPSTKAKGVVTDTSATVY